MLYPCCSFCLEPTHPEVIVSGQADTLDTNYPNINHGNDDRNVLSCHTLHVGSIPHAPWGYVSHHKSIDSDDLNYSVEMSLRDFQRFLDEGQSWYSGDNTRTKWGRNGIRNIMTFDPCNALGAEVSLCDFLMHNHNNIDIKVHESIHSEEIQISDNRRSAVLVITAEGRQHLPSQQQEHVIVDDAFNLSLEVQPIHTFDDLLPPNLMNASFDMHNGDEDVATVDMNESYCEEAMDDQNSISSEIGRWLNCDEAQNESTILLLSPTRQIFDFCKNTETVMEATSNTNNYNTNHCPVDWLNVNDDGTTIDCHPTSANNSVTDNYSAEICNNLHNMLEANDQSSIHEISTSSAEAVTDIFDNEGLVRVKNSLVNSLTGDDCNNEYTHDPLNFAALLVLQLLVLAVSHGLRGMLEICKSNGF